MKEQCPQCDGMFAGLKNGGLRAHGPVGARCQQDPALRGEARECGGCGKVFRLLTSEPIPPHGPTLGVTCPQVSDEASAPDWQALASDAAKRHQAHEVGVIKATEERVQAAMDRLEAADPGPGRVPPVIWAAFDGTCSACGADILAGDCIRASVAEPGTWECEEHNDPWKEDEVAGPVTDYTITSRVVDVMANAHGSMGGADLPDQFADPSAPRKKLNVSGQPDADRDDYGRYAVKDPATGDYRRFKNGGIIGITRVTTFVKAAQDTKALNDWGKRNVVIGASRRPDLIARADGMTHAANRDALDRLVGELETAAGAKVAADIGTQLHEFTERMDAGLVTPDGAPPMFQDSLRLYRDRLAAAGFEAVPGLIERTTMISEWGGVCGTLDRIMYHRPSGTYVVVDLKTGKGLQDYGLDETYAQEWMYAHGVNQNGIYDWNTKTWGRPQTPENLPMLVKVREDVGLIVHMPVQGPKAGQLFLLRADLARGREYAELCASNRGWKKSRAVEWTWEPDRLAEPVSWGARFAAVRNGAEARALWDEADASGVSDADLASLVAIARAALADKG
jgi:hypothetical protein